MHKHQKAVCTVVIRKMTTSHNTRYCVVLQVSENNEEHFAAGLAINQTASRVWRHSCQPDVRSLSDHNSGIGARLATSNAVRHSHDLPADHRGRNHHKLSQLRGAVTPRDAYGQHSRLPVCTGRCRPRRHVHGTVSGLVRVDAAGRSGPVLQRRLLPRCQLCQRSGARLLELAHCVRYSGASGYDRLATSGQILLHSTDGMNNCQKYLLLSLFGLISWNYDYHSLFGNHW